MSSQEQESNLDYKYTNGAISAKPIYDYQVKEKIDILIKALGTMVLFPDEVSDPVNIGKKIYRGTKQMPILLDDNRELALKKLVNLIEQL